MVAPNDLFADYVNRKSHNTILAQQRDLNLFADFLRKHSYANFGGEGNGFDLQRNVLAWSQVSYRALQQFIDEQIQEGHAISSINRRISTIKNYAKLAAKTGVLDPGEYAMMTTISNFSSAEKKRIDSRRSTTHIGNKKRTSVPITQTQAKRLKDQPDTAQGRRDRLLMCLLLEHGLRVGEVVALQAADFDLELGVFYFERPNMDGEQIHKCTSDTLDALHAYVDAGDSPKSGALLRGSLKSGKLTHAGISDRAIQARVRFLGEQIGLFGLSPHDCRHYWATYWADKVDVLRLQEAGGWSSLDMPRRYVERSRIANVGMTGK